MPDRGAFYRNFIIINTYAQGPAKFTMSFSRTAGSFKARGRVPGNALNPRRADPEYFNTQYWNLNYNISSIDNSNTPILFPIEWRAFKKT